MRTVACSTKQKTRAERVRPPKRAVPVRVFALLSKCPVIYSEVCSRILNTLRKTLQLATSGKLQGNYPLNFIELKLRRLLMVIKRVHSFFFSALSENQRWRICGVISFSRRIGLISHIEVLFHIVERTGYGYLWCEMMEELILHLR